MVKVLVRSGADFTLVDDDGQTALELAVLCEHDDVVKFLQSI